VRASHRHASQGVVRGVFFDLDGTLADTAPDLVAAVNAVRREEGLGDLALAGLRDQVSNGGAALVQLAFPQGRYDQRRDELTGRFLKHYHHAICHETTLFPGMAEVLTTLESQGLAWGVVTNKPAWLTEPLMAELGLAARATSIVSGDTTPERKPDPLPLRHACQLAGVDPAQCLYVGDAQRDIQAGTAAGMRTVVAAFGYIARHEPIEAWGADTIIDSPGELLTLLTGMRSTGPLPVA